MCFLWEVKMSTVFSGKSPCVSASPDNDWRWYPALRSFCLFVCLLFDVQHDCCSLTQVSPQTWSASQTPTWEPANFPPLSTFLSKISTCGSSRPTGVVSTDPEISDKRAPTWPPSDLLCGVFPAEHPVYNLYAVSNHTGNTLGGHYTAYCRNPALEEWYSYNDARYQISRHPVTLWLISLGGSCAGQFSVWKTTCFYSHVQKLVPLLPFVLNRMFPFGPFLLTRWRQGLPQHFSSRLEPDRYKTLFLVQICWCNRSSDQTKIPLECSSSWRASRLSLAAHHQPSPSLCGMFDFHRHVAGHSWKTQF